GFDPRHPPHPCPGRAPRVARGGGSEPPRRSVKRRAKIVCTLGPATSSPEQVRALVRAGMDVARLNFSHGTRAEHAAVYREVRAASDAAGRAVALMVDLQGPKIRLGTFANGGAVLEAGATFTLTTEPGVVGTSALAGTTYAALARDVTR